MNWKRRVKRNFLFALVGGVAVHAVYFGLLFTERFHGLAVSALEPAIAIVNHYLDPKYSVGSTYRFLEEFGVSIALYIFWIVVLLLAVDGLRQLKRKLSPWI